ncbi:sag-related sequence srs53f [Cystoisospora suis]|uniref:Sag-related sequence srs53f n=1 Tax=Cystoisospora suis TaxID=483139 RepID=A0A2C6KEX9_9APIC|nr:sag-related sequence srs53f [Cystoisospora suis]
MDRSFLISRVVLVLALSTSGVLAASGETAEALTLATEARILSETSAPQKCLPAQPPQHITVKLNRYTLEANFDCGIEEHQDTNQVEPDLASPSDKCCNAGAAAQCNQSIKSLVGVSGSTSMDNDTKIITVKLDDTPTNTKGKLYFRCKNSTPEQSCIVTVDMPEALGQNECNFDKNVSLPAISEPNTEATFQCGGTPSSKPVTVNTQVYKGPECTGSASNLGDLVPGATLVDGGDGNYTLKVAALPTDAQDLCFKCDYPDPRNKAKVSATSTCKVTVAVSGTPKTTTAPTTSATQGIVVTSLPALVFALFSAARGVYY